MNKLRSANDIQKDWDTNPRWKNVKRDYTAEEVAKCSGSVRIEHTLARNGAEKLWNLINTEDFVNALGALTGNQAMQQAKAGLKAVYLSGWQVAGDANTGMQMYSICMLGFKGKPLLSKPRCATKETLQKKYFSQIETKIPNYQKWWPRAPGWPFWPLE